MTKLKMLTTAEMAQLVNGHAPFKRRLAAACLKRYPVPVPAEEAPVITERLFEAIGMACDELVQQQGAPRDPIRYHLACDNCELDRIVEITTDPSRIQLKVTCCGCARYSSFSVPEGDATIACKNCGQETKVRRLKSHA